MPFKYTTPVQHYIPPPNFIMPVNQTFSRILAGKIADFFVNLMPIGQVGLTLNAMFDCPEQIHTSPIRMFEIEIVS